MLLKNRETTSYWSQMCMWNVTRDQSLGLTFPLNQESSGEAGWWAFAVGRITLLGLWEHWGHCSWWQRGWCRGKAHVSSHSPLVHFCGHWAHKCASPGAWGVICAEPGSGWGGGVKGTAAGVYLCAAREEQGGLLQLLLTSILWTFLEPSGFLHGVWAQSASSLIVAWIVRNACVSKL